MKSEKSLFVTLFFVVLVVMPIQEAWNATHTTQHVPEPTPMKGVENSTHVINGSASPVSNRSLEDDQDYSGALQYENMSAGDKKTYLGMEFDGDPQDYWNWKTQTGKGLAVWATFASLAPQLPVPTFSGYTLCQRLNEVKPLFDQGLFQVACVTWSTSVSPSENSPSRSAPQVTKEVADGTYDSVIDQTAQWVKQNFPYKLLLRLNAEFDTPSVLGWGVDKTAFLNCWRRIVDIFRSEGVNAEWVWSPNCCSDPGVSFADYYPGDRYVDWVGVSLYSNSWGWLNFEDMLCARETNNQNSTCPYDFAISRGKKFMIAEWGLNRTMDMSDEQNVAWITSLFDAIEKRDVKMIVHWSTGEGGSLLKYPLSAGVYRARIAAVQYADLYP